MSMLIKLTRSMFVLICFVSCAPKSGDAFIPDEKRSNINPLDGIEVIDVDVPGGKVKKVSERESKIENFSCTDCHDQPKRNWSLEALKEDGTHDNILAKFKHADSKTMNCMTCHTLNDRDKLHLLNGEKISFNQSFKLCSQCHTNKFKDWRNGAHGKRLGFWSGESVYKNCADCHDPHKPSSAFPKRDPLVDATLIRKELIHLAETGHGATKKNAKKTKIPQSNSVTDIYKSKCSKCHGLEGAGIEGKKNKPPLTMLSSKTVDELNGIIKNGYKGDLGKMPEFGSKLNEEEIKALVKHIKTFEKN